MISLHESTGKIIQRVFTVVSYQDRAAFLSRGKNTVWWSSWTLWKSQWLGVPATSLGFKLKQKPIWRGSRAKTTGQPQELAKAFLKKQIPVPTSKQSTPGHSLIPQNY